MGERTVMLAFAATRSEGNRVAPLLGRPDLTERRAEAVRALLGSCDAPTLAERLARCCGNRSRARLAVPHIAHALRTRPHRLADTVLCRVK